MAKKLVALYAVVEVDSQEEADNLTEKFDSFLDDGVESYRLILTGMAPNREYVLDSLVNSSNAVPLDDVVVFDANEEERFRQEPTPFRLT